MAAACTAHGAFNMPSSRSRWFVSFGKSASKDYSLFFIFMTPQINISRPNSSYLNETDFIQFQLKKFPLFIFFKFNRLSAYIKILLKTWIFKRSNQKDTGNLAAVAYFRAILTIWKIISVGDYQSFAGIRLHVETISIWILKFLSSKQMHVYFAFLFLYYSCT